MTFFDFIVLTLAASSVVAGALRGIVRSLLTLAALVVGLVVAARGYAAAGSVLKGLGLVETDAAAHAGGFLLIVTAALAGGFFAGRLVKGGMRQVRLEWFDRLLGGAFGLLRGWLVCSILYLALTAFPVRLGPVEEATTAPILAQGVRLLGVFTSEEVRALFYEGYTDLVGDN